MQGAEADFDFGNHRLADIVELAVEEVGDLGDFDDGAGGRQLARADHVLAVRAGIDAVRVLRDGDVRGERGLRIGVGGLGAVDHGNLGVADGEGLAVLDRLLDAGDVEEHAGVHLGRHHVFVARATFGVVLVGGGEAAVIRGGDQVHVAVDLALPAHFHGLGVDAGEQAVVLGRIVEVATVVRLRNVELVAAEHAGGVVDRLIDRVALVREDAVEALDVRDLGDRVAFEDVAADTGDAAVDLVVDPEVLAVVSAVGVRTVDVVGVAGLVLELAVRARADDLLRLVGDAPAAHAVDVEGRDALDLTPGRQAEHAAFAGVAAGPHAVVGVEFARRHVQLEVGGGMRRVGRRRSGRCSSRRGSGFLVARRQADRQACAGKAGKGCGVQELAAARVRHVFDLVHFCVIHDLLLPWAGVIDCNRFGSAPLRPSRWFSLRSGDL